MDAADVPDVFEGASRRVAIVEADWEVVESTRAELGGWSSGKIGSTTSVAQPNMTRRGTNAAELGDGGGWGVADRPVPPSWGEFTHGLDVCEIDRRPATLPPDVFEAEYLRGRRPVVIVGGAREMAAKTSFRRDAFFDRLGGEVSE